MFHVASLHFPARWETNSSKCHVVCCNAFVQFKCHVDHQHHAAVGHVTMPTRAAMVRPVLDCLRPPLATLQNGVKVWQEFRGETLPLSALKAGLVCIKVAPSAQLVVVLHIVVVLLDMSDAVCADEKPDAILEQESPHRSCISFCPPVCPRSHSAHLKVLHKTKIHPYYIYIYTYIYRER